MSFYDRVVDIVSRIVIVMVAVLVLCWWGTVIAEAIMDMLGYPGGLPELLELLV